MTALKTWAVMAAGLLLSACVTTTGAPGTQGLPGGVAERPLPDSQLFGDYLVGAYADDIDDAPARAQYYARAFAGEPDSTRLGRLAVTSAITAGDMKQASRLAKEMRKANPREPMARALLGAEAFAAGRYERAQNLFAADTADLTVGILMSLMKGWVYQAQGETDAAKEVFANLGGGGYFTLLGDLENAKIDALSADASGVHQLFEKIEDTGLSPIETALSKARALSAAGDVAGASEFIQTFSAENGDFETGPVRTYMDRLRSGKPIGITLTPQQEASRALTDSAWSFFVRNRAPDAGEVYLRYALMLDPNHDKAKLWLGSLLESAERGEEAHALYASVSERSPYWVSAQLSKANVYFRDDEDEKALAVLEKTNADYPSFVTRESLGRARLIRENYEAALPIYDALVKSLTETQLKSNTEPLYFRGICYERTKQWDKAEADFLKVLELDPENADAMNYLGYTWVDRGENLSRAFDLIKKAVKAEPTSGAITDSLGWAYYKLGQYQKAKVELEKATELSPSSATIIDHLGDVYWKLGRFREAGYQWKRALDYDPTDEERAMIEKKLQGGLEAVNTTS